MHGVERLRVCYAYSVWDRNAKDSDKLFFQKYMLMIALYRDLEGNGSVIFIYFHVAFLLGFCLNLYSWKLIFKLTRNNILRLQDRSG